MDRVIRVSILQGVLLLAVLTGLGSWPSWLRWGPDGVAAMGWAAAICTVALVASLLVCGPGQSDGGMNCSLPTVLSVMGVRISLTLAGAVGVYLLFQPQRVVYAGWLVADYFVLLMWETRVLLKLTAGGGMAQEKPAADRGG